MSTFWKFKETPEFKLLTEDQKQFAKEFFGGGFIHLTGEAGTGKSFIINTLFRFMERHGQPFAKTASTGVSAFNIGGSTVHSFFGLGLAEESVEQLIIKVRKNKRARERIFAVKTLLIDEISMISGELLNKIDIILKYFRQDGRPFGGVKTVIATGDFLQLLPVMKNGDRELAFQSRSWKEAGFKNTVLKEIVRQKNKDFSKLLSRLRVGDSSDLSILTPRFGAKLNPPDGIQPLRLFCTNKDVDSYNLNELKKNNGISKTYCAKISGPDWATESFKKNCPSPIELTLKLGASVMITANIDQKIGLVNGTMGVVKGYSVNGPIIKTSVGEFVIELNKWEMKEQVPEKDGSMKYKTVATMEQIPLRIAYALTIHRVQGLTIDWAVLDLERAFSAGQMYVALSRVRSLDGVSLINFPEQKIFADQDCLDFYSGK
jgi:ATP-dependent exoDNAse (exonuclease V) alpha subunit